MLALIGNRQAEVPRGRRCGGCSSVSPRTPRCVRGLIERPALPTPLRAAIAAATTADVSHFAAEWLDPRRAERTARDGREQAFVAIAADCAPFDLAELVDWLPQKRASHRRPAGAGVQLRRRRAVRAEPRRHVGPAGRAVFALIADTRGQAFASLYARAKMPAALLPAFRIAAAFATQAGAGVGVDYALTTAILRAVEAENDAGLAPVVAMFWRLAGEGARADAREFVAAAAEHSAAPAIEEAEALGAAPPVLMMSVEAGNENLAPPVTLDFVAEPVSIAA